MFCNVCSVLQCFAVFAVLCSCFLAFFWDLSFCEYCLIMAVTTLIQDLLPVTDKENEERQVAVHNNKNNNTSSPSPLPERILKLHVGNGRIRPLCEIGKYKHIYPSARNERKSAKDEPEVIGGGETSAIEFVKDFHVPVLKRLLEECKENDEWRLAAGNMAVFVSGVRDINPEEVLQVAMKAGLSKYPLIEVEQFIINLFTAEMDIPAAQNGPLNMNLGKWHLAEGQLDKALWRFSCLTSHSTKQRTAYENANLLHGFAAYKLWLNQNLETYGENCGIQKEEGKESEFCTSGCCEKGEVFQEQDVMTSEKLNFEFFEKWGDGGGQLRGEGEKMDVKFPISFTENGDEDQIGDGEDEEEWLQENEVVDEPRLFTVWKQDMDKDLFPLKSKPSLEGKLYKVNLQGSQQRYWWEEAKKNLSLSLEKHPEIQSALLPLVQLLLASGMTEKAFAVTRWVCDVSPTTLAFRILSALLEALTPENSKVEEKIVSNMTILLSEPSATFCLNRLINLHSQGLCSDALICLAIVTSLPSSVTRCCVWKKLANSLASISRFLRQKKKRNE